MVEEHGVLRANPSLFRHHAVQADSLRKGYDQLPAFRSQYLAFNCHVFAVVKEEHALKRPVEGNQAGRDDDDPGASLREFRDWIVSILHLERRTFRRRIPQPVMCSSFVCDAGSMGIAASAGVSVPSSRPSRKGYVAELVSAQKRNSPRVSIHPGI